MNTEISRYLVDANGNSFSSDTDLQSLSNNSKVKNTNSGVSYKKVQGTTPGVPVFDKVPFQEGQPDAVLYSPQSLTTAQKQQARANIGASGGDAVLYSPQSLTTAQKQQARTNIGASGDDAVLYSQQTLTSSQKEQARANIGAIDLTTGRNNFVSTTSSQTFDISTTNRILKNIGIFPFSAGQRCNVIPLGDYQVSFGQSTMKANNIMDIIHQSPFCSAVTTVVSPLLSRPDDNAVCGLVAGTSGPRGCVVASGSADHNSRVHYVSFGKRFKYNQLGVAGGNDDYTSNDGTIRIEIPKASFDTSVGTVQVLVDMFISRDASSSDYVEFTTSSDVDSGTTRLTTEELTEYPNPYSRGYDFDLGLYAADSNEKDAKFIGYDDYSNCKLIQDSTFRQFKMRSFVYTVTSEVQDLSQTMLKLNFGYSVHSGSKVRVRVLFPGTTGGSSSSGSSSSGSSSSGSSSGGSSSPSTSGTWGVKKFNTVNAEVGQPTMSVGQTVSEGKIVKIYALTHWTQTSESLWSALDYTDWYYIWKDNNYTLTNADKSQINSLPDSSDYGSTPEQPPHVILSYTSGNI